MCLQDINEYNLIFISPEAVLNENRNLLKEQTFGKQLIAIAIDKNDKVNVNNEIKTIS